MKKIKVLITSKDYGAAENITEIIKSLKEDNRFEFRVLSSNPAYKFFLENNIESDLVDLDTDVENYRYKLINTARNYIEDYKPDAILTGVSGFTEGIDEAVILVSKEIVTFSVQDFWGYVNNSLDSYPDYYFVIDSYAKKINEKRYNTKSIVLGAVPKYTKYKNKNFDCIKRGDKIVFFGQPLWKFDSYTKTLRYISEVLDKYNISSLYYKPHPTETNENLNLLIGIFKQGTNVIILRDKKLEEVLFSSSLAISINSTVIVDLAYLMKYYNKRISLGVFLTIEEEQRDFFYANLDIKSHPMSVNETVLEIQNKKDFEELIENYLYNKNRKQLDNIFNNIKDKIKYSNEILALIKSSILTKVN